MFKNLLKFLFCLFLFSLGFRTIAQARGWSGPSKFDRLAKLAEGLDLSTSQRKELLALQEATRASMAAGHKELVKARFKLHAAMQKESSTREELAKLNEDMIQIRTTLMRKRFETMLAIRTILTPEQLKNFLVKVDDPG